MKTKTQKTLMIQLIKSNAPDTTKRGLTEGRRRVASLLGKSISYIYQIEKGSIAPSESLTKLMKLMVER